MKLNISRFIAAPALLASMLLLGGCTKASSKCEGQLLADGTCTARCDASLCEVGGSTCVANKCASPCESHRACAADAFCARIADGSGTEIGSFCIDLDLGDGHTGKYEACTGDENCDTARGFSCVDDECVIAGCGNDLDCGYIGPCATANDGATRYCDPVEGYEPTPPVKPESMAAPCPDGSIPRDAVVDEGGACADAQAAIAACNSDRECTAEAPNTGCHPTCWTAEVAFNDCMSLYSPCDDAKDEFCFGSGREGDPDAYCSRGCTTAGDACGEGLGCALVRSGSAPCEEQCGASPGTSATCIPSTDIGEGKAYDCGHGQLLRSVCRKNDFCQHCDTDADCSAFAGQICARDQSGAKLCTQRCDPNLPTCPGGDEAACAVHDSDLGFETCAHRFGSCAATDGAPCAPCLTDKDCGGDDQCISFINGSRHCVDFGFECNCDPDTDPVHELFGTCQGGCPDSPSGMSMMCIGSSRSALYQTCIGARIDPAPLFGNPNLVVGCWPKIDY